MRPFRWKLMLWILGVLLFAMLVIWPLVDRQLMQIPMTNGLAALRNHNLAKFSQSFTPDAHIVSLPGSVTVHELVDRLSSMLDESGGDGSSVRFGGYSNLVRHGSTVLADVTFIYDLQNDEIPYHSLPTRWTEGVTLEKVGVFTWKIKDIRLKDDALNTFYTHWMGLRTGKE